MKIAIITRFKKFLGGVETVTGLLKRIFENEGHYVDVISLEDSVAYEKLRFFNKLKILIEPYILSKHFHSIQTNYDLIICNGECGFGIQHPKSIILFHGSYYGYRNYLHSFLNLKQFLNLSLSSLIQIRAAKKKYVVAVSQFTAMILKNHGIKVNKVISNCINTDFFYPDKRIPKSEKYLFVGSHDYYGKGFDVLEKLANQGIKIDCVTNVKPDSDILGWMNKIPYDQMSQIYPRYKALIFPSRFEGMQLAPIEAMACGLPVVISNVGLGPKLKRQCPEFVVDGYDNRAVNEYIRKIDTIERNYDKFSQLAQQYVLKNHSYSRFKKEWLDLIRYV